MRALYTRCALGKLYKGSWEVLLVNPYYFMLSCLEIIKKEMLIMIRGLYGRIDFRIHVAL